MTASGLMGPFFFEASNGTTVTVNKDRYVGMLEKLWLKLAEDRDFDMENIWFQQDLPTHQESPSPGWKTTLGGA